MNVDTRLRVLTGLHRRIFEATGGRVLGKIVGMTVVVLTTTGRKSGLPRTTMLTTPVQDGDCIVLVASKGGSPHHPVWFLNLEADPKVEAQIGGRKREMLARVASSEEKAELWPRITAKYRGYVGYQKRTDRDIPVVILEPR